MQQVFIRLWEKRESIDESVDLDGYLFIITRNMIFNRSRRSFNEKAYKEAMEAVGSDSYTLDALLVIETERSEWRCPYRLYKKHRVLTLTPNMEQYAQKT